MRSVVKLFKEIRLLNPIMIIGLPGIGFVANLSVKYMIKKLGAERLAGIRSPHFQDLALAWADGGLKTPVNELYYQQSQGGCRDLIIYYGNTQALTVLGQYELSGRILDFAQDSGCNFVISLGGLRSENPRNPPQLYSTHADLETMRLMQHYDIELMDGRIYGMAGVILGLASLRQMRGFCLLAETKGIQPDVEAAERITSFLINYLGCNIDLSSADFLITTSSKGDNGCFTPLAFPPFAE